MADPDHELLDVVGRHWPEQGSASVIMSSPTSVLDAWLRLHERGFEFPAHRQYPDTATMLTELDLSAISAIRPDLGTRAVHAMADLSIGVSALEISPRTGGFSIDWMAGPDDNTQPFIRTRTVSAAPPPATAATRPTQHDGGNWRDELRSLDEELARGHISADDYRIRRDRILASAVSPTPPPQT